MTWRLKKKKVEKMNETKSWFFEKKNKSINLDQEKKIKGSNQ